MALRGNLSSNKDELYNHDFHELLIVINAIFEQDVPQSPAKPSVPSK